MDIFFVTRKREKSTRDHICVQFFVIDKSFVYIVSIKKKGEILQTVKQFAKNRSPRDYNI